MVASSESLVNAQEACGDARGDGHSMHHDPHAPSRNGAALCVCVCVCVCVGVRVRVGGGWACTEQACARLLMPSARAHRRCAQKQRGIGYTHARDMQRARARTAGRRVASQDVCARHTYTRANTLVCDATTHTGYSTTKLNQN